MRLPAEVKSASPQHVWGVGGLLPLRWSNLPPRGSGWCGGLGRGPVARDDGGDDGGLAGERDAARVRGCRLERR
jgi:hypothetical protein